MNNYLSLVRPVVLTIVVSFPVFAQFGRDASLAQALANASSREKAVNQLIGAGTARVSLLLEWATHPPSGVDGYELRIGLADAFGALRVKEAIPFLIRNISIDRTGASNTWIKSPEVVEGRLAAAAALIQIGSDSAEPISRAWPTMTDYRDRLAAVFVISRLPGVPWARTFLQSTLGEANLQRSWIEDGLQRLGPPR